MNNSGIMTEEQFNEFVNSGKPCIFDFSATWCGPCRMLAPVVEDLADKYKGKYYFYNIDIDSSEELAIKYGIEVVPTIVIFNNGKEVGRTSGYMPKEQLESYISSVIK